MFRAILEYVYIFLKLCYANFRIPGFNDGSMLNVYFCPLFEDKCSIKRTQLIYTRNKQKHTCKEGETATMIKIKGIVRT